MNSAVFCFLAALLVVAVVQGQEECGRRKCNKRQYCLTESLFGVEYNVCLPYRVRGALCDEERLKCSPELECKKREGSVLPYTTCQRPGSTTTSTTTTTTTQTPVTETPEATTTVEEESTTTVEVESTTTVEVESTTTVEVESTTTVEEESTP